jgi:hypothetical protein
MLKIYSPYVYVGGQQRIFHGNVLNMRNFIK